jgi:hypothetical protein
VHVVLRDGIVGDGLEVAQLVTMVKLGARNIDEGSVRERNAEGVDTNSSELVDGGSVEERSVTLLKDRSALAAEVLAKSPLIRSAITTNLRPPDWIVSLLLLEPSTEVGTVSLECLPVDEVTTVDAVTPGDVVAVADGAQVNSGDGEWALLVVGNSGAVVATVLAEVDTKRGQQLVQVVRDQTKDAADQTGGGSSTSSASHEGGGENSGGAHLD